MILFLLTLGMLSLTNPTSAQADYKVLVWSGNGALHVEVMSFEGNASNYGYEVVTSVGEMNTSILEGIDVLIVNGVDYINDTKGELDVIVDWFNEASGRALWLASDSDYGGYWYPWGTTAEPVGVNHIVIEIEGHIFVQDDAIIDAGMNDGAGYRPICNVDNTIDSPANKITKDVVNTSWHGPTCVVPYSSVTTAGVGTVANYNDIENCQWVVNTSVTSEIQDQDFDDDDKWEGYPTGENSSKSMLAIEWNLGDSKNKLAVMGESFFSNYKNMYGSEMRYQVGGLQNIELLYQLLDWSVGKYDAKAPGFEILTGFIALALIPLVLRKRK